MYCTLLEVFGTTSYVRTIRRPWYQTVYQMAPQMAPRIRKSEKKQRWCGNHFCTKLHRNIVCQQTKVCTIFGCDWRSLAQGCRVPILSPKTSIYFDLPAKTFTSPNWMWCTLQLKTNWDCLNSWLTSDWGSVSAQSPRYSFHFPDNNNHTTQLHSRSLLLRFCIK